VLGSELISALPLTISLTAQGGMDQQQLAIAHTREIYDPSAVIDNMLQHPLRLQSAYMDVTGSEPEFTSCHDRFCGTVDYIWYTPQVSTYLSLTDKSACHAETFTCQAP